MSSRRFVSVDLREALRFEELIELGYEYGMFSTADWLKAHLRQTLAPAVGLRVRGMLPDRAELVAFLALAHRSGFSDVVGWIEEQILTRAPYHAA